MADFQVKFKYIRAGPRTGAEQKLAEAAALWTRVWNHPEFARRLGELALTEKQVERQGQVVLREDASNAEVLAFLLKAAEGWNPVDDGTATLKITVRKATLRERFFHTLGATNMCTGEQDIMLHRFLTMSPAQLAGHLAHEYCHVLGFWHRKTHAGTVPYAVGDLTTELAQQFLAQDAASGPSRA